MSHPQSPSSWRLVDLHVIHYSAHCTCGECLSGYISPRMKWILLRYASIFKDLLPRSLPVFEECLGPERSAHADFMDLDIYGDLQHMPVTLTRKLTSDIRIMHGYCEVFGAIMMCLEEGRVPTPLRIEQHIRYSWSGKMEDAKLFLLAGGKSDYAIHYLLDTVKEAMLIRNGVRHLDQGLSHLPRCLNDTGYDLVEKRLLQL